MKRLLIALEPINMLFVLISVVLGHLDYATLFLVWSISLQLLRMENKQNEIN